jgi:hypothetical protein
MTRTQKAKRNVGRIDHVIFAYQTFERAEETRQKMTALLGLDPDDWEDPTDLDPPFNLCTQVNWPAGLEIICPSVGHEDAWFGTPLIAERGEGIGAVVFGVEDLDEVSRRAERVGVPVVQMLQDSRHPDGPDAYQAGIPFFFGAGVEKRFHHIREALIGPFNGTGLALGEFQPLDGED